MPGQTKKLIQGQAAAYTLQALLAPPSRPWEDQSGHTPADGKGVRGCLSSGAPDSSPAMSLWPASTAPGHTMPRSRCGHLLFPLLPDPNPVREMGASTLGSVLRQERRNLRMLIPQALRPDPQRHPDRKKTEQRQPCL